MGYALFAQRKLVLDSQLNSTQIQQTQRTNEQFSLANDKLGLQQQLSSIESSQAGELAALYDELAKATDSDARNEINAEIQALKNRQEAAIAAIENEIYKISVEEQGVEMEVKRLDTQVTATQKDLEAVEEAEGQAIDRAQPKYKGL